VGDGADTGQNEGAGGGEGGVDPLSVGRNQRPLSFFCFSGVAMPRGSSGRPSSTRCVIGPGKFHVRGVFSVRGIGAVQALFLTP
jgi:hypothetical protein